MLEFVVRGCALTYKTSQDKHSKYINPNTQAIHLKLTGVGLKERLLVFSEGTVGKDSADAKGDFLNLGVNGTVSYGFRKGLDTASRQEIRGKLTYSF